MEIRPAIIVVTPVKNEAWILPRFLSVASRFADHIIVADQNSTDESVQICKGYSKVVVIKNDTTAYNEAYRQSMLIEKARDLVRGPRIILALDSDEILAANAINQPGWRQLLEAKPGTTLYFEKPDLWRSTARCIRYSNPWPLGYVDDGAEHRPGAIHSLRVPVAAPGKRLAISDVKFLHYGPARMEAQCSKLRFYSVFENVKASSYFLTRRRVYGRSSQEGVGMVSEESPAEWFDHWTASGIDMTSIARERFHWMDFEVLRQFAVHGVYRFWFDDIWDFDWRECCRYGQRIGVNGLPLEERIIRSPRVLRSILKGVDIMHVWARTRWRFVKPIMQ